MFDENQIVTVKWHSHNKKYYTGLGIEFTKIGETFAIPAHLLLPKSRAKVKCICDYCNEEYETNYAIYTKSISRGKLACEKCKQKKREDSFIMKYGVSSPGASNECREKAHQVMIEKYGCKYALQSEQGQENFKNSMKEKYGEENPSKIPEFLAKSRNTSFLNGTTPTSLPERQIIQMLIDLYGKDSCIPGYPVDRISLDCLLIINNVKIDVEYDGKYWHNGREDYDRKRNHWLISQGYKVLRILGNVKDELPSIDRLREEVEYLINGHNIGYIDMNN